MELTKENLLAQERSFWIEGKPWYEERLHPEAVMVFPEPTGFLTRDEIIEALESAPRWRDVEFSDVRLIQMTSESAVLIYKATGYHEEDDETYVTLASSVYCLHDRRVLLACHQQSPVDHDMG